MASTPPEHGGPLSVGSSAFTLAVGRLCVRYYVANGKHFSKRNETPRNLREGAPILRSDLHHLVYVYPLTLSQPR